MKKSAWVAAAVSLPFLAILLGNAQHYLPFISDDALISLRYARRLLEGQGLSWSAGHPVEGYSNLLWILLTAFIGLFGADLVWAARFLGFSATSTILFSLSYWHLRRNSLREIWFPLAIGLLFLSLGAPMAVWAIGGLEQPLYGALIALSVPLLFSVVDSGGVKKIRILSLSLVLGLLCLTRPDGPMFAAVAAATIFLGGRAQKRPRFVFDSLLVLSFPFLFYAGQLIFRVYYYGEWVPNTALVKITPSYHHFLNGLRYLRNGIVCLFPFSALAMLSIAAMMRMRPYRIRGLYLFAASSLWSLYLVFIGGDIFPAYRHFIPLMVFFAFALTDGASIVLNSFEIRSRSRIRLLLIASVFASFVPYTYIQFANPQSRRAVEERWEWTGRDLGLLLGKAFSRQQPLLAVTAAGCLPYWSNLPSLDMLGLNDYYIPRHRPKSVGDGYLGHEFGDGKYVLSREPDIIIFNVGSEPVFKSGLEMLEIPEFHRLYMPVQVETAPGEIPARIYVNQYSRKIGVRQSPSKLVIPGYLLTGSGVRARLNPADSLVAQLNPGQSARIHLDFFPGQKYSVAVDAFPSGAVRWEMKTGKDALLSLTLFSESTVPVEIRSVVLSWAL